MQRNIWLIVLGLVFGGLAIWVVLRLTDTHAVLAVLARTDRDLLLAAVAALFAHLFFKTLRWRVLLGEKHQRPLSTLLPAVALGSGANVVIPHSGEVIRALIVRKRLGLPATFAIGSIAVERIVDVLTVTFLTVGSVFTLENIPAEIDGLMVLVGIFCLFGIGILFVLRKNGRQVIQYFIRYLDFLPEVVIKRLQQILENCLEGVRAVERYSDIGTVILLSVLQWAAMACCIAACIAAMQVSTPITASIIVLFFTIAGLTLPTAPGYVGTLQVCFVAGLAPFSISSNDAVAAAITYNLLIIGGLLLACLASSIVLSFMSKKRSRPA